MSGDSTLGSTRDHRQIPKIQIKRNAVYKLKPEPVAPFHMFLKQLAPANLKFLFIYLYFFCMALYSSR